MTILGIETSCDETAAAVCIKTGQSLSILSNVIATSLDLQAKYGGVIPEQAAREQVKSIIPVIKEALIQSNLYPPSSKHYLLSSTIYPPAIDAIAVTLGPGLIGSLLVGVETAKALALIWNKPLIPVNHLLGHFYANWITHEKLDVRSKKIDKEVSSLKFDNPASNLQHPTSNLVPNFPCIGLLVSGGHTDLVLFTNHGKYDYLGGTRDDAAGECFDKCARLLNMPYPGGPQLAKLAEKGNPQAFNLPRPMIKSDNFDFSFSGLKTAVARLVSEQLGTTQSSSKSENQLRRKSDLSGSPTLSESFRTDLAASIEQAIVDVLVAKTIKAAKKYRTNYILVAGGVAANIKLKTELERVCKSEVENYKLFIPAPALSTDNAVMIATCAIYNFHPIDPFTLQANPSLSLKEIVDNF